MMGNRLKDILTREAASAHRIAGDRGSDPLRAKSERSRKGEAHLSAATEKGGKII
jgi:hypothetical protein